MLSGIRALTFDTGGTIVDWHRGVSRAFADAGARRGVTADWPAITNEYRRRSLQAMRARLSRGILGNDGSVELDPGRIQESLSAKDPRVRVKVGRQWRDGTAHLLPDDDVRARMRELRRPVNDVFVRAAGSDLMTVRIDLDLDGNGARGA